MFNSEDQESVKSVATLPRRPSNPDKCSEEKCLQCCYFAEKAK